MLIKPKHPDTHRVEKAADETSSSPLFCPKALFSTTDCELSRRMERWALNFSKKVQHLRKQEKRLLSNRAHEAQTHNGDAGPWTLASGSARDRLRGVWETQWSGGLALTLTCVNEPLEVRVQLLPSWITPKRVYMRQDYVAHKLRMLSKCLIKYIFSMNDP